MAIGARAPSRRVAPRVRRLVRFESLLVQYLQTITVYVDSKDRSLGGPELRAAISRWPKQRHAARSSAKWKRRTWRDAAS